MISYKWKIDSFDHIRYKLTHKKADDKEKFWISTGWISSSQDP